MIIDALAILVLVFSNSNRRRKLSIWFLAFHALLTIFLVLFRVDERILVILEGRFLNKPLEKVDGIILLGGSEEIGLTQTLGEPVFNEEGQRILKTAILAIEHPQAKIVVTGGVPDDNEGAFSEADVAAMTLVRLSVPNLSERLLKENKSHNTYENFVQIMAMVNVSHDETWVIVTSAIHMPRAVGVARKLGWQSKLETAGCNWRTAGIIPNLFTSFHFEVGKTLYRIDLVFREILALVFYYVRGYTSEVFPNSQHTHKTDKHSNTEKSVSL